MRTSVLASAVALLAQAVPLLAVGPSIGRSSVGIKTQKHPNPELVSEATFDQLLNHSDPSAGTFKQRYWYDAQYWKGPGSPVFVFNVGESAADDYVGYLYNGTIPGRYALEFGGAVIVIEHRFWGESIPFTELTAETLQYLDLPQSVFDMTYFAQNVKLEFDTSTNGGANAAKAPWVLIGGSYPGALAAWTQQIAPGVFHAYHASSAVVEAIYDFNAYFDAVAAAIPKNCSSDVKAVIQYVDKVFDSGVAKDIATMKNVFGLGNVSHSDDFAAQLATPLWGWQGSLKDEQTVFKFCDYIETASNNGKIIKGKESGVGLDIALANYGSFVKTNYGKQCKNDCSSYADNAAYDDPTDTENDRQWNWLLCHNPFDWWQVGPPKNDGNHVVSAQLRPTYYQRQCPLMFPTTNGKKAGSVTGWTADHLNTYTNGWNAVFERVLFVNGQFDPWLPATVGSPYRPGGARNSSAAMPIYTIAKGNHVPDLIIDDIPEEVTVLKDILATMGAWLKEFTPKTS